MVNLTYNQLAKIIYESSTIIESNTINRSVLKWIKSRSSVPFVKVLQGIRRSGKSLALKQYFKYLVEQGVPKSNILFLNFENPLLAFCNNDMDLRQVYEVFARRVKHDNIQFIILDEVQEVKGWERFVRWLYDTYKDKVQIYVTGSNSKLLSSEFGTLLAGRHISKTVFPFYFKEILRFYHIPYSRSKDPEYLNKVLYLLEKYLYFGGMPEIVRYMQYISSDHNFYQNDLKLNDSSREIIAKEYLTALTDRIIGNDIVDRFNIRDSSLIRKLTIFLMSNIGKIISLRNIQKVLSSEGYDISIKTLDNYISYLQDAFLIYKIPKFDYKTKRIFRNVYKYYSIDNGFITSLSMKSYLQEGNLLENLVFLYFYKKGYEVFYAKNGQDIDFIIRTKKSRLIKVQVAYSLNYENIKREVLNLINVSKYISGKNLLITYEDVPFDIQSEVNKLTGKSKIDIKIKRLFDLV